MYFNPYDFERPVKDPKLFAGRHRELNEISYYLELAKSDSPRFFNLALIGVRSSGKTSLLNMIEFMANEKGFLPVKISLNNEIVESDVLLFKEVFDGIMTKGVERGMYDGLKGNTYRLFRRIIDLFEVNFELPLLFGTAYVGKRKKGENVGLSQQVLIHDLGELYSEAKKHDIQGIVLLFDECDLLAKNETLLQKMRNAFQEVDGYMLVFSGTERMFPTISEVFSPIPRFFEKIDVGNFKSVEETRECILNPLSEDEKKLVEGSSIVEIHSFTGGSPYEINLVAHHMYKRYKESKTQNIRLTVEVLDDILEKLERLRVKEHHKIASKIRSCWIPHLKILVSLVELGKCNVESLARYMLLEDLHSLTPRRALETISVNEGNIEILMERGLMGVSEESKLVFQGDQFDLLYLKYFALANGITKIFVGMSDEPIINLQHKLQSILCEGIKEYEFRVMFDKTEMISQTKKKGRLFVGGFYGTFQGEVSKPLISPEIDKRFYLGSEKSLRFRVNVEYLETGFVMQITFSSQEDKNLVESKIKSLIDKLEIARLRVILDDEISWNIKGAQLLGEGRFSEAISMFDKAIEINPIFELPWINKARAFFDMKEYDRALECCEKTLEIRPSFSEAWELKGRSLFHKKEYDAALPCFKKAVEIDPENWLAWDNQGRTLFNLQRFEEATICFDKVLKDQPNNIDVIRLYAVALSRLGLEEKAAEFWDMALRIKPQDIEALFNKAWLLAAARELDDALIIFEKVIQQEPKIGEAWAGKGYCLLELGRLEEAIQIFDKSLEINPQDHNAWYNKACALSRLERVDESLEALKKAISIDKDMVQRARRDKDFENIKENPIFKKLTEISE